MKKSTRMVGRFAKSPTILAAPEFADLGIFKEPFDRDRTGLRSWLVSVST